MTARQARGRVKLSEDDQAAVRYINILICEACEKGDYTCNTGRILPPNLQRHFTAIGFEVEVFDRPTNKATHHLYWCNPKRNK